MMSTPVDSECGTTSCPAAFSFFTTCDPIRPVPPITANFMGHLSSRTIGRLFEAPMTHWGGKGI